MARQPYLTRLALGRSAYDPPTQAANPAQENSDVEPVFEESGGQVEPRDRELDREYRQQYDTRGHSINPASRALVRSLIRAQNDVLATVGVAREKMPKSGSGNTASPSRSASVQRIENENMVGLAMAVADGLLLRVSTWWIKSLREYLLVYRAGAVLSLKEILEIRYSTMNTTAFFFAGLPSQLLRATLFLGLGSLVVYVHENSERVLLAMNMRGRRKRQIRKTLRLAKVVLMFLVEAFCAPISMFSHLQSLGLIAADRLPPWHSLNPFSPTSPWRQVMTPLPRNAGSLLSWLVSDAGTPVSMLLVHGDLLKTLQAHLFLMFDPLTLRPGRPDSLSLEAADDDIREDYGPERISILWPEPDGPVSRRMTHACGRLLGWLGWGGETPAAPDSVKDTRAPSHQDHRAGERRSQVQAPGRRGSDSSSTATSQLSPALIARTRVDHTDHLVTIDVELPMQTTVEVDADETHPETEPGRDEQRTHVTDRPEQSEQLHRVTYLSLFPTTVAANHISRQLAILLLIPIEAYMLRRLASGFLRSVGDTTRMAELHAAGGRGLGVRGLGILVCNMALCYGVDLAADLAMCTFEFGACVWIGKRWCRWGAL